MLQSIMVSTTTMPLFGYDMFIGGVPRVENCGENWTWPQQSTTNQPSCTDMSDPIMYVRANSAHHPQPQTLVQPRHHSIATSHILSTRTATPLSPRHQMAGNMVMAQPALKPTWQGFLDTTRDAMTVVEATLQGRLNHISRRPRDKERAGMLASGSVLVYEEKASGVQRWTDAVQWSPSRVMNNCLIYRQLVRALKPEEKRTAVNPSCSTKRKRKENAEPSVTKTSDNVNDSDDEHGNSSFDGTRLREVDFEGKVYAKFAQNLSPAQQRRFCGSLIDSYEFKEGGLMKKTISVKCQGTHYHVISYYSLEDVVSGKLKRPFQDPRLEHVQPRPELLTGWKVSLEDEESNDMPLIPGYPQHIQSSHVQHQAITAVTQVAGPPVIFQAQSLPPFHVPEYWHNGHVQQFTPSHHSPQHCTSPQAVANQHIPPAHAYQYPALQPPAQQHVQPPSPQPYPSQQPSNQSYSAPTNNSQQYTSRSQSSRYYSIDHQRLTPKSHYPPQVTAPHYAASHHPQPTPTPSVPRYTFPSAPTFDFEVSISHTSTSAQKPSPGSVQQHDPQRRASAPVALQPYTQLHYHPDLPYPATYYVQDAKYLPNSEQHGY